MLKTYKINSNFTDSFARDLNQTTNEANNMSIV